MHLQTPRYTTTHDAFFSTPRDSRLAAEIRRLRQSAVAYVNSMPTMAVLGDDPLVSQLVSAAGFPTQDAAVIRIMICRQNVTAICVPTRVWRNPGDRADLVRLKREAAAFDTRCILVPQRWLRNADRAACSNAISGARGTRFTRKDGQSVLKGLESSSATIGSCAALIPHHPDPYGVVLAMAATGLLVIDRTRKLGPASPVRLPARA